MRKNVKFPAPMLSQLKEVNLETDMKGRHYAELAASEGQIPEEVALSILKDLVEEDANKLTLNEERYLFMLVKISSLENNYKVDVTCTHRKEDGSMCGHVTTEKIKLSDADLKYPPKNYKVPELTFTVDDKEKEYLVMPPTVDMECALMNWFVVEKGVNRDELMNDKKASFEFTYVRSVMHLVDKETNERAVKDVTGLQAALDSLDKNSYKQVHKLYEYVQDVNQYGLTPKVYEFTCKECGGKVVYHLPLLDGLVGW